MPVADSVALTWAFGTTAPEGSVTVPLIEPRNVWAFAAAASERTTRITKTKRFIDPHPPSRDQKTHRPAATPQHALVSKTQSFLKSCMANRSASVSESKPSAE